MKKINPVSELSLGKIRELEERFNTLKEHL
jgi:hypothetical protein